MMTWDSPELTSSHRYLESTILYDNNSLLKKPRNKFSGPFTSSEKEKYTPHTHQNQEH